MQKFDIYFSGQILPDSNAHQAKAAIGDLFKLKGQALEKLFSGKAVRIKAGVDVETANRYRKAFRDVGALVDISPHGQPPTMRPAAANKAPSSSRDDTAAGQEMELLPPRTGSLADCTQPPPPAPIPDIDWMTLDLPGVILDETPSVPEPQVDISRLSMCAPRSGSLEDCPIAKPAGPLPDISDWQLSPARSGSLEDCSIGRKPVQLPDISHLEVSSEDK